MPGMSLQPSPAQPTAQAFIRHPRPHPSQSAAEAKSALFVCFALTSAQSGAAAHTHRRTPSPRQHRIKPGSQGGSCQPAGAPPVAKIPGRARCVVWGLRSYQTNTKREIKAAPFPPPTLFHERRTCWSCKCENFLCSQHSKAKVIFSWLRPLIANAHRSLGVCLLK